MEHQKDAERRGRASQGSGDAEGERPPDSSGTSESAQEGFPATGAATPTEERAVETPRERRARTAHRIRLYIYVVLAVVLVGYLIALGVANTTTVEVSWVFGSSSIALVWLVLSAAVIGLVLGLVISLLISWRTRRPHKRAHDAQRDDRSLGQRERDEGATAG